ncbi:MAG: FecR domain-containing protein, partial [Rhizorhabdus sp.]
GPNAFVTITLPDASAISLPSQSRIRVEKLRRVLLTGGYDRNFVLEAGRSRSSVTPIRDSGSNFRVTTPLSVSAVRGTDFRVALDPAGDRALTEVVGGTVGVAPDEDKDAVAVPKSFGTIATPAGVEQPTALLPGPKLLQVERTGGDGVMIGMQAVDGATRYRTQLATDLDFRNVIAETVSDTPAASFNGLGNVSFYVRLTAIAASGLEGLPATYALGQRPVADAGGSRPQQIQFSMTGDGRTQPATLSAHPTLR